MTPSSPCCSPSVYPPVNIFWCWVMKKSPKYVTEPPPPFPSSLVLGFDPGDSRCSTHLFFRSPFPQVDQRPSFFSSISHAPCCLPTPLTQPATNIPLNLSYTPTFFAALHTGCRPRLFTQGLSTPPSTVHASFLPLPLLRNENQGRYHPFFQPVEHDPSNGHVSLCGQPPFYTPPFPQQRRMDVSPTSFSAYLRTSFSFFGFPPLFFSATFCPLSPKQRYNHLLLANLSPASSQASFLFLVSGFFGISFCAHRDLVPSLFLSFFPFCAPAS